MALESATYINGLVSTNPTASDNISQGDDHIRLLKASIKATFPNITAAMTLTQDDINAIPGNIESLDAQIGNILADPSFTGDLLLTDTSTGSEEGPYIELHRNSASPAANDLLGTIYFSGEDSLGDKTIYATIDAILTDPTEASEDGSLRVRTMRANVLTEALRVGPLGQLGIGGANYGTSGQFLRSTGSSSAPSWQTFAPFEVPTGAIFPYAGTSAPSGYLLAFGQAISRTTYADLFSAIGTTYGSGDGSTTFTLPDLRGRAIAGQDDMGGTSANRLTGLSGGVDGDVLGAAGGSESHTLTEAQMPLHGHPARIAPSTGDPDASGGLALNNANQSNYPAFTGTPTSAPGEQIGGAGGGAAHNNVQPTIILNYIIKT